MISQPGNIRNILKKFAPNILKGYYHKLIKIIKFKSIRYKYISNKNAKYYDHIFSFGANCEPGFQYQRFFGNVEPMIWTWANVWNVEKLISSIDNLNIIFSGEIIEHSKQENMWICDVTKIGFHASSQHAALVDKNDNYIPEKLEKEISSLKARISHLGMKLKHIWSTDETQLYVMTLNYQSRNIEISVSDIEKLHNILKQKTKNASLLLVVDVNVYDDFKILDNGKDIYVRLIYTFAPWTKVATNGLYDLEGWDRICSEFRPKTVSEKTKKFKFET
jgi:hypothetical protein